MIRPATPADLEALAAIQAASPEAARWNPPDYLACQVLVALSQAIPVGFLAARTLVPDEHEILTLAVHPAFRRQGFGRELLTAFARRAKGYIFLEVRAANQSARNFYKSIGFREIALRRNYYEAPPDDGVVMKFHSC